jgi:hypothetical protein
LIEESNNEVPHVFIRLWSLGSESLAEELLVVFHLKLVDGVEGEPCRDRRDEVSIVIILSCVIVERIATLLVDF